MFAEPNDPIRAAIQAEHLDDATRARLNARLERHILRAATPRAAVQRRGRHSRRAVVLVCALITSISVAAVAIAASIDSSPRRAGAPDLQSLNGYSVFDRPSKLGALTEADYAIFTRLVSTQTDGAIKIDRGIDHITRADLPQRSEGRTLYRNSRGQRIAAIQLTSGQICFLGAISEAESVSGCAWELGTGGINHSGAWTKDGAVTFGIATDAVTRVQVVTNRGATEDARLANNGFWWNSDCPSRRLYPVALRITRSDGTVVRNVLPDEGSATNAPPSHDTCRGAASTPTTPPEPD